MNCFVYNFFLFKDLNLWIKKICVMKSSLTVVIWAGSWTWISFINRRSTFTSTIVRWTTTIWWTITVSIITVSYWIKKSIFIYMLTYFIKLFTYMEVVDLVVIDCSLFHQLNNQLLYFYHQLHNHDISF
jgi:hypothetical protein